MAAAAAAEASAPLLRSPGVVSAGEVLRMRAAMQELLSVCDSPVTLAVGDRRGRVRVVVAAQSGLAISVDEADSESAVEGLHVRLDARVLDGFCRRFRACPPPCRASSRL